jgi:hypothetical protein
MDNILMFEEASNACFLEMYNMSKEKFERLSDVLKNNGFDIESRMTSTATIIEEQQPMTTLEVLNEVSETKEEIPTAPLPTPIVETTSAPVLKTRIIAHAKPKNPPKFRLGNNFAANKPAIQETFIEPSEAISEEELKEPSETVGEEELER